MATANLNEPTSASDGNIPYIGAAADDGTGNSLREAINRLNARVRELYGAQNASNVVQTPFVDGDNIKNDTIDSQHYAAGSIDNEHLADNAVDHDELANRYTVKTETNHATGAYSLDWSAGTTWEFTTTLTGNIELDFTNFKQGQVIDIYGLTGAFTITLDSDAATTETFNKVGGVDYDGASTNHLQVVCLDDSDDAVFNYTIATYVSDTTPS